MKTDFLAFKRNTEFAIHDMLNCCI